MSDPLKAFESLDYPGRRKPVNRQPPKTGKGDTPVWDSHPATYIVAGEKREFFYIGALAAPWATPFQSIRAWESQGLLLQQPLPIAAHPPGRTWPAVVPARASASGPASRSRSILTLAKQHKVIHEPRPPTKAVRHRRSQVVQPTRLTKRMEAVTHHRRQRQCRARHTAQPAGRVLKRTIPTKTQDAAPHRTSHPTSPSRPTATPTTMMAPRPTTSPQR